MTTGLKTARKQSSELIQQISFNDDMKYIKPLKKDKPNYGWRELIVWNRTQSAGFRVKEGISTLLSMGMLFGFIFLLKYFPIDNQEISTIFGFLVIFSIFSPILMESFMGILMVNKIADKTLIHLTIYHSTWNRTFEIQDIVKNVYSQPRHPITKASANTNRGCLEIEFMNKWHMGNTKTQTHHIFDSITIWGNSRYLQSLEDISHTQSLKTDILGVPVPAKMHKLSVKVDEADAWAEDISQYVGISWATRETAAYKPVYTYITKTDEPKIKKCVYCDNPLTDNELVLTNHWVANQFKEKMVQSSTKAAHEAALKDQQLGSDLVMTTQHQKRKRFYKQTLAERLGLPRFTQKQWLGLIILGLVLFALSSDTFQATLKTIWARIAGTGATTQPPITTTTGGELLAL